jgi:aarF domain-containing kinase
MTSIDTASTGEHAGRLEIVQVDLPAMVDVDRLTSLRRLGRITAVVWRRLVPVIVTNVLVRDAERRRARFGRALALAVTDLGVTFVKLGQLLASSPSIAGQTLADAMRGVLDDGPSIPFHQVRAIVEDDLGRSLTSVFSSIDEEPFAAASLAVVHRATLLDGTPVAVKVLRPASATLVATDLSLVRPFVRWLARNVPVGVLPAVPDTIEGLAEQLAEELDLRNEARAMRWFEEMIDLLGTEGVAVPATVAAASGPRVLTMAYVDGAKIDDLAALAAGDIDARQAVKALIESWFALALCTGVFHGDMHAGNLLLTPTGEVVLLDWGIVGRLPAPSLSFFRRSLEGALGDESAWPEVRDHLMSTMPADVLATMGLTPDVFLQIVRAQTLMIMTAPFSELDLMMLAPGASLPGVEPVELPTTSRGWVRFVREERRKAKASGLALQPSPPRGEMLLIKQLVFFERYGKLFLGDEPLIYDPDVYRTLLAATGETAA